MATRREFLKLSAVAGLCAFFRPPRGARAEPQAGGQPWGFPLAFPAHFLEVPPPRRPGYDYYLSVVCKNG